MSATKNCFIKTRSQVVVLSNSSQCYVTLNENQKDNSQTARRHMTGRGRDVRVTPDTAVIACNIKVVVGGGGGGCSKSMRLMFFSCDLPLRCVASSRAGEQLMARMRDGSVAPPPDCRLCTALERSSGLQVPGSGFHGEDCCRGSFSPHLSHCQQHCDRCFQAALQLSRLHYSFPSRRRRL